MGKKIEKTKETAETIIKVAGVIATVGSAILTTLGNKKKS